MSPWSASVIATLIAVVLVGCGGPDEAATDPTLDLDTMTVDAPEGRLDAAHARGASVGAVDEDLFVAVVVDGNDSAAPVRVYLCDGDSGILMQDTPTADRLVLTEGTTQVELDLSADSLTGSVVWHGGDRQRFAVAPATGDAGLYWATATLDGRDFAGGWIVLEDGRQRGWYEEEEEELQM